MLYFKIYFAVRHHRNQIQALQEQQVAQNSHTANASRLRKSAVGVFYVYLVFWLCYVPQFCSFALFAITGTSTGLNAFVMTSTTLLFLNSSLIKPCCLLLEDETHSTGCSGHTATCLSKSKDSFSK